MMKPMLTLLLACLFALPTKAQTLDAATALETVQNYLREEGFRPAIDEDGDVAFKIRGYRYFVRIAGMNDGSLLTYFYTIFTTEQPYQKMLEACNLCNSVKNAVKFYALRDDDGTVNYRIGMETFCNTDDEFLSQIKDAMNLVPRCVDEFIEEYEE